ncbi:MAG: Adenylate cyclase [Myxococcaceae bacterium]|nr:Adenylate cyclase [Myxococcaceae bacterium]MEA2752319.1 adenylate cyclase [Myxococcales bacterium]
MTKPLQVDLAAIQQCFQGVVPAVIATCSAAGEPNVTYLSQVYFVDRRHVAVSRQFFNKTVRNITENPYASIQLYDPMTFEAYELDVRFVRSETKGPLFETMAVRIEAIASLTGMKGIFKLIAADVYEVTAAAAIPDFLQPTPDDPQRVWPTPPERRSEVRALQVVSDRMNRAADLEELLGTFLVSLRDELGFEHSMLFLPDDAGAKLFTVASIGYGESGIGAEIELGTGLVGTVAQQKKILRLADLATDLRYGRAIRGQTNARGEHVLTPEIPLPGLPDAQSHLAIPLLLQDRLVGVLAVESRDPLGFDDWHEAFLNIVGNQAAIAIERMVEREDDEIVELPPARPTIADTRICHALRFYKGEDCIFVDGEYLIRNVPARILWKVLRSFTEEGRTEFTNRELRLDPWLELPAIKDNLESRLILLRKRLEQKCPDLRLASCARGRFRLEMDCRIELEERES